METFVVSPTYEYEKTWSVVALMTKKCFQIFIWRSIMTRFI